MEKQSKAMSLNDGSQIEQKETLNKLACNGTSFEDVYHRVFPILAKINSQETLQTDLEVYSAYKPTQLIYLANTTI